MKSLERKWLTLMKACSDRRGHLKDTTKNTTPLGCHGVKTKNKPTENTPSLWSNHWKHWKLHITHVFITSVNSYAPLYVTRCTDRLLILWEFKFSAAYIENRKVSNIKVSIHIYIRENLQYNTINKTHLEIKSIEKLNVLIVNKHSVYYWICCYFSIYIIFSVFIFYLTLYLTLICVYVLCCCCLHPCW